jgi:peptidoglycan/LPS O-acetylase OafA/YrhL
MALFLLVGALIVWKSPFYANILADSNSKAFHSIDGLRGYLALSVFICHGSEYFYYINHKYNKIPALSFYELIGDASVSLFFMITGFLFWTKIIAGEGHIDVRKFAVSRIARLVPMYFVIFGIVLLLSLQRTDFVINDPRELILQVGRWLALGALGCHNLNGVELIPSVNDNLWTLKWEWCFYVLLPLAAFFWKGTRFVVMFIAVGVLIAALPVGKFLFNFLAGMMSATILARIGPINFPKSSYVGIASAAPIAFTLFVWPQSYGLAQTASLLPLFFVIAAGETLFGLFTNKAARGLGAMSYSIYIIHLVVLYVAFHATSAVLDLSSLSPSLFWVWLGIIGAILIGLCSVTFRLIELPFIAAGHKAGAKIRPATT